MNTVHGSWLLFGSCDFFFGSCYLFFAISSLVLGVWFLVLFWVLGIFYIK
jgi:hypothetical protein